MLTDLKIAADRRPMTTGERWFSGIAIAAFSFALLMDLFTEYSAVKLSVLLIFVFWVPLLVLHECGHAFVAAAVGWRVREMVIGFGPTLWRGRVGDTLVKLRLVPLEGYVLPEPQGADGMRWKSALVYAAGPGAELALLAVLVTTFGWAQIFQETEAIGWIALQSLIIAIILGVVMNLLPFRVGHGVSDGLGILLSPFMTQQTIDDRLIAAERDHVMQLLSKGEVEPAHTETTQLIQKYPDSLTLAALHTQTMAAAGQVDAARTRLRQQIASSEKTDQLPLLLLQADIELAAETPDFLTLDSALQQAQKLTPAKSAILARRAASHVLKREEQIAAPMLKDVWRQNDGSIDDAFVLLYLTIAAQRLREFDAAARFHTAFCQINRQALLAQRLPPLADNNHA
ncbi:MAG: site-2 protease family protein [Pseudomonadota bacterium]